ncbi:hypothetical protein MXB_4918 [Myxobolus squamalis]|nr:hypothetical protein MXB_4918 [Myxobolus squamalis]
MMLPKQLATFYQKEHQREFFQVYHFKDMIADGKYKFFKYEFNSNDICDNSRMIFTHVAGHLYNIDFPDECNDWFRTPYETLFNVPLDALKRLARTCQHLVIWTDCDREGENIGFEIINTCKRGTTIFIHS